MQNLPPPGTVFPLLSHETRAESFASSGTPPSTLGVQSSSSTTTSDVRVENSPATTSDASTPAHLDYSLRPANIVTEFTKRKGWSGLIIQGFRDFYFILTADFKFKYSAPATHDILGYNPEELLTKDVLEFVHPHDRSLLEAEFKDGIATKQQLRLYFRFQKKDESYTMLECHAHCVETNIKPDGHLFFVNARPYPTKAGALLDSFLEHKIENLRLKRRIEDLRREEAEEYAEEQRLSTRRQLGSEPSVSTGNTRSTIDSDLSRGSGSRMPASPDFMSQLGLNALTRQNLSKVDAASASRSDNMREKMARFKGDAHLEEIEMRTGLLLREGERTSGMGGLSPSLIRGDPALNSPLDRDEGDKKKKVKFTEEYVCRDCGTLESPEWRKGPQGPKSLCNACGLRWAKQEKRRSSLPSMAVG